MTKSPVGHGDFIYFQQAYINRHVLCREDEEEEEEEGEVEEGDGETEERNLQFQCLFWYQ